MQTASDGHGCEGYGWGMACRMLLLRSKLYYFHFLFSQAPPIHTHMHIFLPFACHVYPFSECIPHSPHTRTLGQRWVLNNILPVGAGETGVLHTYECIVPRGPLSRRGFCAMILDWRESDEKMLWAA